MSSVRMLIPAALLLFAVTGCGSARLIQSSPEGGVVAIPSNSNYWPLHYRSEAEKLMAQRCPNGYDIVEEREVVVGKQSTTSEVIDRNGSSSQSQQTTIDKITTVSDQTEYRITFRARDSRPASPPSRVLPTSASMPAPPAPLGGPGLPSRPQPVTGP